MDGPRTWGLGVELQLDIVKVSLLTKYLRDPRNLADSLDTRPKLRKLT
jgi:hypothetical protein